jgi:hypothetical protein
MQNTHTELSQFAILEGNGIEQPQLLLIMSDGTKEFHKILNSSIPSFVNTKLNVTFTGFLKGGEKTK